MSQEYGTPSKKYRRAARNQRNRPVLVTTSEADQVVIDEPAVAVEEPAYEAVSEPVAEAPARARRLPRFFSTIGRGEQESTTGESGKNTVAQARLARATRNKAGTTSKTVAVKDTSTKVVESGAKSTAGGSKAPAKPASPFKTRYIFGMLIYVVVSTFVSSLELNFMTSNHLEKVLTTFNLFGMSLPVSSFTLVYLATLVILLIILAYFDFLPRGFSASARANQARMSGQKKSTTVESASAGPRVVPPVVRQGVKGEDDDLYQEYRLNQRRDKKR